jgi:hypothetical protein
MSRFSTLRKRLRSHGLSLVSQEGKLIVPDVLVKGGRVDKVFDNLNEVETWTTKQFPTPKPSRGKKVL